MPKSRIRRRNTFTPPKARGAGPGAGSRWVAPLMLTLLVLGLLWIVVFYLAGSSVPLMKDLGNWNLAIGMGLITGGFLTATRWK